MTKQADALKSDINTIMARWIAHGTPPSGPAGHAQYGDFTNVDDYHTALNKLEQARQQFQALPSAIRKHVKNDPGAFLDMVFDPERRGELEELGLVEAQAPESAPAAVVPDPPEAPPTE